jgi:hypothetical protein
MVVAGIEFIFPLVMLRMEREDENGLNKKQSDLIWKMFYLHLCLIPFLIPAIIGLDSEWIGRKKMLSFAMFVLGLIHTNLFQNKLSFKSF